MEKFMKVLKNNGIAIALFLFIFILAYILHLFGVLESYQQFVVVLASAAATYIIVCVTMDAQSTHQLELQKELSEWQNGLQKQLKENEDKLKRDLEFYNAKLEVYSDFVSSMYETIKDNQITEEEFINLRTILLGKVCFYINNKDVLQSILKELSRVKSYTDNDAMSQFYAGITSILQKDLREMDWSDTKEDVLSLSGKFDEISDNTNKELVINESAPFTSTTETSQQKKETSDIPERLEQQSWHFIMWGDEQLQKLKGGFKELSLVEYDGVDWRTNLVKQVGENDVIMLFRRGGYGYVGAYRAVGWRVFYFEEEREEIQIFGEKTQIKTGEQYIEDIKEYDIYDSKDDGATTCANIIVEPIAFVENGVGNPGGVYRRTISRYDSHYAWKLCELFGIKDKVRAIN